MHKQGTGNKIIDYADSLHMACEVLAFIESIAALSPEKDISLHSGGLYYLAAHTREAIEKVLQEA